MTKFIESATNGKFSELSIFLNQPVSLQGRHYLMDMDSTDLDYQKSVAKLLKTLPKALDKEIISFQKKLNKEYFLDYPDDQLIPIGILVTCGAQLVHLLRSEISSSENDMMYCQLYFDRDTALDAAKNLVDSGSIFANELKIQIFRVCAYKQYDSWPREDEFDCFNALGAKTELEIYLTSNERMIYQCWEDGEMSTEGFCYDKIEYSFQPQQKELSRLLAPLIG